MRPTIFDALCRCFCRVQATLALGFMAGMPFADQDVVGPVFLAAMGVDVARWTLRRRRRLPVALGGALVCCGLALAAAAVAGGAASPPLPAPAPHHPGAPLFSPRSGFLTAVDAAGGGGFLFSLAVAMGVAQAGVFLLFAGERSAYIRRYGVVERPERLSLALVPVPFAMQFFFLLVALVTLHAGVLDQPAPADAAAALGHPVWRAVTAARFLVSAASAALVAMLPWWYLNAIALQRELRLKHA